MTQRIEGHNQVWNDSGEKTCLKDALKGHFAEGDHLVKLTDTFKVIYKLDAGYPIAVWQRNAATAEGMKFKVHQLIPCARKLLVSKLHLPRSVKCFQVNLPCQTFTLTYGLWTVSVLTRFNWSSCRDTW